MNFETSLGIQSRFLYHRQKINNPFIPKFVTYQSNSSVKAQQLVPALGNTQQWGCIQSMLLELERDLVSHSPSYETFRDQGTDDVNPDICQARVSELIAIYTPRNFVQGGVEYPKWFICLYMTIKIPISTQEEMVVKRKNHKFHFRLEIDLHSYFLDTCASRRFWNFQ